MRVKTDVPLERLLYGLKWRGLSYDYYDGRAWTLRRRERQPTATQGRFYKLEESVMGSELIQQTFYMEETLTNSVFAIHPALAVSTDAGFLWRDSSDNLFAQYPALGKTDYTVVSDTILPDLNKISDWTPVPDDIRETWLQLPELDQRIIPLAREITRGYRRQYDKALAIETWLRSNYGYTTTLPEIYEISEVGDPLAVFLFETREGYCEYFATAMTVMLRAVVIPARITGGFLAGEYNPISGSWTVRRKHSHIWTEAWFPPYGWVEFDATPDEEFPAEPARARFFADLADAAGLWWRENVAGYDASRQYSVISGFFTRVNQAEDRAGEFLSSSANRARGVFNLPPQTATAVKITALIILFAAVSGIFIFRRTKRRITGVFRRNRQNPRGDAADFYAEALVFLKARGFRPEKAQTPLEFARGLGAHPAAAALLDLTRFYNEARFGDPDAPFPRDEARALRNSLKTAFGK
jgi:transglutaminase-like putative cysteine protease